MILGLLPSCRFADGWLLVSWAQGESPKSPGDDVCMQPFWEAVVCALLNFTEGFVSDDHLLHVKTWVSES